MFGGAPALYGIPGRRHRASGRGEFGLVITGPADAAVVVDAFAKPSGSSWMPARTRTLGAAGTSTIHDFQSTSHPSRFYRIRWPGFDRLSPHVRGLIAEAGWRCLTTCPMLLTLFGTFGGIRTEKGGHHGRRDQCSICRTLAALYPAAGWAGGLYQSASEYIRDLVRRDYERAGERQSEALCQEWKGGRRPHRATSFPWMWRPLSGVRRTDGRTGRNEPCCHPQE